MPSDVARASLYQAKINVWVEDEVTRSYLTALWNDPDIAYLIGGGNEGVAAITHEAYKSGYSNVFAVVDRDLRPTNINDWFDPKKTSPVFILPVHEVENYLLNPDALAECSYNNRERTRDVIETYLKTHAERLCWWAACCVVVAELKQRFRNNFMTNPKYPTVSGEASAVRHILNNAWFKKLGDEVARSTEADIRSLIMEKRQEANVRLEDGTWRNEFAGKEILRHVGSQIFDQTRLSNPPNKAELESDLAKDIADWQVKNNCIPSSLTGLRSAMKQRIKRPTGPPR